MRTERSGIIAICGPTAAGKSAVALQLAQHLQVPLLSADSRQIYRDFTIGTAKPSAAEQAQWPHHLIDIADPTETFTVAEYKRLADRLITAAHEHGQTPIVVGGTGLYIQALVEGLAIPAVAPNPQLRHQLEAIPQPVRHAFLQQVDPTGGRAIHLNDSIRTVRSLEVYYTAGRPLSQLQKRIPPPYSTLAIGLRCNDMNRLTERIAARVNGMLELGWLEEVTHLRQTYGTDLPLLQTLGYRELGLYLDGQVSLDLAKKDIVTHTRQFAKRQMTWFRRTPGIVWFDRDDAAVMSNIQKAVAYFLNDLHRTGTAGND
ncbi:MAG: tRNA (adenosine(37)-N6)-dimethylallyltransferase MiaA [Cyanobacteria bacterium J06555_12]